MKRKRTQDQTSQTASESGEDEDTGDEDEDKEQDDGSLADDDGSLPPNDSDEDDDEDPLATSGEDEGDPGDQDHDNDNHSDQRDERSSSDESEVETQAEKDRKTAYFDSETISSEHTSFLTMNLSRPILKAITSLGYQKPTPIQASTVPVALLGKDVVGGAVTGSGKTAAFTIPMLERLLYRDKSKRAVATRCLVLVPTRELAVQCYEVGTKLATHTDIRFCLIVGTILL